MSHLAETIQAILDDRDNDVPHFTPTRYPFTYAYDFVRANATRFGFEPHDPRVEQRSSSMIREYAERTGQDQAEVLIACADAYLAYYGILAPEQVKADRIAHAKQAAWKSLGLDGPVHRPHDPSCTDRMLCSEHAPAYTGLPTA